MGMRHGSMVVKAHVGGMTYFETTEDAEMLKKVVLHSAATALASMVLPSYYSATITDV